LKPSLTLLKNRLVLSQLRTTWHNSTASTFINTAATVPKPAGQKRQFSAETKLRHATENVARDAEAVQHVELMLDIQVPWTKTSEEWKAAVVLVAKRRYQRCLDALEGLIVSRMFELTKMNMSQTGAFYLATLYFRLLNLSLQAINYENTLQRPLAHGRKPSALPSTAIMMPLPP
jgi:hypothetical protein